MIHWLSRTLTRKFTLLLAGFLILQICQIGVSVFGIVYLGEEGAQINAAAKQRMRTLLLENLVRRAVAGNPWDNAHRHLFENALAESDAYFPWLRNFIEEYKHREALLTDLVDEARSSWEKELRPLLIAVEPSRPEATRAALAQYTVLAPAQAARIDKIVSRLENHIRAETRKVIFLQSWIMGLSLLLSAIGMIMAHFLVTLPLRRLTEAAQSIAAGAYDKRVLVSSQDELGVMAGTFNRMAEAIGEKTSKIAALNEIAVKITSLRSLRELLDEVMRRGMELSGVQAACIGFYNQENHRFEERITEGLPSNYTMSACFGGGGLAEHTFMSGTFILSSDRHESPYKLSDQDRQEGIKCFVCLPLTSHTSRLGVMSFYRKDRDFFLPDEIEILITFSHFAAGAIENARLYEKTQNLAVTDKLTELPNRRLFDERLAEEINNAERQGKPLSLLMLDIDDFKRINDTHGHIAGDKVLQTLGHALLGQLWKVDLAARYGGEEFAVILPHTDASAALNVAERISRSIATTAIPLPNGRKIGATVSIGIACFPRCGETGESLIEHADQALYTAKKEGKNRVRLYREILKAQLERNPARIVDLLNQSLDNIPSIVTAVSAKTTYYHDHTAIVDALAHKISQALNLGKTDRETLHLAAQLHDIGMITVSDAVLRKRETLTGDNWELIRRHPAVAAQFLEQVPTLRQVAPVVRHHHERYDGKGYPDGLKGEDIPYLARVLAVIDAYASMLGEWDGHEALSQEEAAKRLLTAAHSQLDPLIVSALIEFLGKSHPVSN